VTSASEPCNGREPEPFSPAERAQFDASAAEAEAGYSVEFLRSRPKTLGRPLAV